MYCLVRSIAIAFIYLWLMSNQVIVIDGGNTHIKLGWFDHRILVRQLRVASLQSLSDLLNPQSMVVLANVGNDALTSCLQTLGCEIRKLSNTGKLPFESSYTTPETLGIDRICNIAAVHAMHPHENILVIDIGTCIKIDFIDAAAMYQGGTISPGLDLRFKSLHDYTAHLPLLQPTHSWQETGKSTKESIESGVMGSVRAELLYYIDHFRKRFDHVQVYLTGGGAHYFDLGQKNSIFVDENLTLKGIYALYLTQFP
ncbi:MAG: type III pantothenate kinase [Flavobacteriia bacterium]|nr:type III pantothenate kinase [Flavobacteriia bacterium]